MPPFKTGTHVSNNNFDAAELLSALQSRIIVDMDEQACVEALSGLRADYKVTPHTSTEPYSHANLIRSHRRILLKTYADKS